MLKTESTHTAESRWFEHLSRSTAPRLRIFCLPYAGGSADVYRTWQHWFPQEIDVCLVHLPGRGRNIRLEAFTRLNDLVAALADRLSPFTDAPYAL